MKSIKSIVLSAMVIVLSVKGQNSKFYLEPHLATGFQKAFFSSGVGAAFGFYVSEKSSFDIRAREIYNFYNQNIIGAITVTYRYHISDGLFFGGGFAHHHEIEKDTYLCHPVDAALGTHKSIFHRSGFALEAGYNFKPLASSGFLNKLRPCLGLQATIMARDSGLNPLITMNGGLKMRF